MIISSAAISDIKDELNHAANKGELIRVEQCYLGKREVKTYLFRTGFPNGFKSHSVTGWYSTDFKNDGLYMSSSEFANYISTVNGGQGGLHIIYSVERVMPEVENTSHLQPSTKASLSSIIESSQFKPKNVKFNNLVKDLER